jgi:hypothetical protein
MRSPPVLDQRLFSRLIAKIALELIAIRICHVPEWLVFGIDHVQFDPIRAYARFGSGPRWPVASRRIYDEDSIISCIPGEPPGQTIYETDFLHTPQGEGYAIICLFGVEHTINLIAPSTEGYRAWLEMHSGLSPLYLDNSMPNKQTYFTT